jgi:plasmid stabilization system protein ParE
VSHRVSITSKAEAELYGAALWWAEYRSQEQAFRWLEGFEAALAFLAENPERHPLAREDAEFPFSLRQLTYGLGGKPTHRAVFRIREDQVIVYGIRHLAQRDITPEDLL